MNLQILIIVIIVIIILIFLFFLNNRKRENENKDEDKPKSENEPKFEDTYINSHIKRREEGRTYLKRKYGFWEYGGVKFSFDVDDTPDIKSCNKASWSLFGTKDGEYRISVTEINCPTEEYSKEGYRQRFGWYYDDGWYSNKLTKDDILSIKAQIHQ